MAKISGSLPNFANGVSQQAVALRLATQGDLQVNAYSTVVDGLRKRPPTQRIASLGTDFAASAYTHMINRDANERYEVIASSTGIRVFDLTTGAERSVSYPNGTGYLAYNTSAYSRPPYKTLTVGDYTFLTNTSVSTALSNVVEPVSPSEAIIHVMAGNYGKWYRIVINGVAVAQYRTPDGTSAAQSPAVDTNFLARRLATGEAVALATTVNGEANGNWTWNPADTNLTASGITAANGWTVKVFKGTIYIKKNDGADFSIGVEDGYNGNAMKVIQHRVQDFGNLPAHNEEGMAVEVTGSVANEFDNYYVRFGKQSPSDTSSTPGVWREIAAPGIQTTFDAATMPHVLIRQADGSFTFEEAKWDTREAGDEDTCPAPSFIGQPITNLTFFKNRLGFLSGENIILSRAGDYFSWWRATATALLDDDPIDVAASARGVSILRSCEPYADRLLLFADQRQFVLRGNELLTPKTASITPSTAYEVSKRCQPIATGAAVYFAADRGQFSMVREYRIDDDVSGTAEAEDVTGHVPQYIPGSITKLSASTHEDIIVGIADGQPEALWVYKYYWSGQNKLQSSWSQWTFPGVDEIMDMDFVGSRLILLLKRGNEVVLEFIDVQPGGTDPSSHFITHLDQRFSLTPPSTYLLNGTTTVSSYDPYEDTTYVPITGLNLLLYDYQVVTAGGGSLEAGLRIEVVDKGLNFLLLRGDVRGQPLYLGTLYEMRYRVSPIHLRTEGRNGGTTVITEGRLQLLQMIFQFSKTAFFRVEVTPLARDTRSYVTNGRQMGDPDNVTDRIVVADGNIRVPVLSRNTRVKIEVVNDSYLPCSILAGEWVGDYVQKSKRI